MSGLMKIAFWVTVLGQIALLLAFIAVKEDILRSRTSVVLQTVPIDPRSLLQGDFVVLDYEIAALPPWLENTRIGETVYVGLRQFDGEVWRSNGYFLRKPKAGAVFIKGTVNNRRRLDFGISNYFVPEGTGHIIEGAADVKVRVAVSSGGSAVIEELLVVEAPINPPGPPELRPADVPPPPIPPRPVDPERAPFIAPPP